MEFQFNLGTVYSVWINPTLAGILDIGSTRLYTAMDGNPTPADRNRIKIGSSSIINRVDKLHSIVINATGLATGSEYLPSGGKGSVITDFIYESEFSTGTSYSGNAITSDYNWSSIPRDTLIYNSRKPRWVTMSGGNPVRRIRVTAYWKNLHTGETRSIQLAPHGKFTIKLGFYSRL